MMLPSDRERNVAARGQVARLDQGGAGNCIATDGKATAGSPGSPHEINQTPIPCGPERRLGLVEAIGHSDVRTM
jgi:hypothetical protein